MTRNINKYFEFGKQKAANVWQYQLSLDEWEQSIQIYNKNKENLTGVLEVASFYYYAGIEAGSRYEKNRSKRK